MITHPSKSPFESIVVKFGLWHGLAAILVIPIVAVFGSSA